MRSATQSATQKFYSRSHDAVIRVHDEAGNVIDTHKHAGEFKPAETLTSALTMLTSTLRPLRCRKMLHSHQPQVVALIRLTANEERLRHGTLFQIAAKSTGKNYHPSVP